MSHRSLSVIITCKNEEKNIRNCIESVLKIADELIIADSGSTDRTKKIASEYDCRIIEREYISAGNFKNWALPQAKNDWVMIVDADERVSPELSDEIQELLLSEPKFDGYIIFRKNHIYGHHVKYSGWGTDKVLRLFKRDLSRYKDMRVHSEVVVKTGRVSRLKGKLLHYPFWNLHQVMQKHEMYVTWAAQDLWDKGKRANFLNLTFRPCWRFFRHYIIKRGFLDGMPGLIVSGISMYYVFLKYVKLWEMQHGQHQPDPEPQSKQEALSSPLNPIYADKQ